MVAVRIRTSDGKLQSRSSQQNNATTEQSTQELVLARGVISLAQFSVMFVTVTQK
jgi:hypothetical protein